MFAVSTQASLFPQEHKQDDMNFVLNLPFDMNENRVHALQTKYTFICPIKLHLIYNILRFYDIQ